ncbi:variable surface protein [Plasmodium gonderi]|uniref:Variable surface protein n=1 Tax=Plasmodium gonderi TaxID=77519 RepID=A0A1Y1JPX0_PLAGO|nr:variable surface protein [Plasmodium gonderi]GAW84499.1 variable surface protein [Plasmodium gonderi]
MDGRTGTNNNFDFSKIFPTCFYEYYIQTRIPRGDDKAIKNKCQHFRSNVGVSENKQNFLSYCKDLFNYIDYVIKKSFIMDIKSNCIYLNFELNYAQKYYGFSKKNTKDNFESMINVKENTIYKSMYDTCAVHINDLDDDTFSKIDKLSELNKIFYSNNFTCLRSSDCYKKYKELVQMSENYNNTSFHKLLKRFKEENMEYLIDLFPISQICEITPCSSRTSSGIIIITLLIVSFTTLIITCFLHKYTIYRTFLQPMISKLRRKFNKNNKDYISLIDTYETEFDRLSENKHQVSYTYSESY